MPHRSHFSSRYIDQQPLILFEIASTMPSLLNALLALPLVRRPAPGGGWREQLARMEAGRERTPPPTTRHHIPVLRHLQSWADGIESTPQMWWHIEGISLQGDVHPSVQLIRNLGNDVRDQYIHKSLSSLIGDTCGLGRFIHGAWDSLYCGCA